MRAVSVCSVVLLLSISPYSPFVHSSHSCDQTLDPVEIPGQWVGDEVSGYGFVCPSGYFPAESSTGPHEQICRFIPPPIEYSVKLLETGENRRPGYLAQAEPKIPDVNIFGVTRPGNRSRSRTALRARVTCTGGMPASGVKIKIESKALPQSGGHQHHDSGRPKGTVSPAVASADRDGYVDFVFIAGPVSGNHEVKAECMSAPVCTGDTGRIWVGVKDLIPLTSLSHLYGLVGYRPTHQNNHHLAVPAESWLVDLAFTYRAIFPNDPLLQFNDASLERGGIFDLNANWQPSHHSHRQGLSIDIAGNPAYNSTAIPERNFRLFEELSCGNGWWANLELEGVPAQHYHAEHVLVCSPGNIASIETMFGSPSTNGESSTPDPGPPPAPVDCGPNPDPVTMPQCF